MRMASYAKPQSILSINQRLLFLVSGADQKVRVRPCTLKRLGNSSAERDNIKLSCDALGTSELMAGMVQFIGLMPPCAWTKRVWRVLGCRRCYVLFASL